MSQLSELIDELCPEGVEYQKLGEIGLSLNGMSAVSNKWADKGNCQFIDYMNAYKNIKIDVTKLPYATVKDTTKQTILRKGDILFTSASEVPNECALSGVIEDEIKEGIFMDDHLFGLRLNDNFKDKIITGYLKYIFRANDFRKQVLSTVRGVTRFYIAKPAFMKLSIPVPPLPIQEEIVRILDKYTTLEVELEEKLEAEEEARKQQYEYYQNKLLTFDCQYKKLSDIAVYSTSRIDAINLNADNYVGVENLLPNRMGKVASNYVPSEGRFIKFSSGNILIGNIRPYLKKIWYADIEGGTNGDVLVVRVLNQAEIFPKFLYCVLSSEDFFHYDVHTSKGAKMPRGNKAAIMNYKVPVPPLAEQQRIVSILEKLEKSTSDLTKEILEEKDARQKQYEYYRDKLLTFKRKETVEA